MDRAGLLIEQAQALDKPPRRRATIVFGAIWHLGREPRRVQCVSSGAGAEQFLALAEKPAAAVPALDDPPALVVRWSLELR